MTVSRYTDLRDQIVFTVGSSERHSYLIGTLKQMFKSDINSERRYERINTIGDLLEILELRDSLSEDNVAPLKKIAQKLHDTNMSTKIADYERTHVRTEYVNYFDLQNIEQDQSFQEESRQLSVQSFIGNDIYGRAMSNVKIRRIHNTLVQQIGSFWRDLARNLKIKEGVIDEIDSNNPTLASKAAKLIKAYEEVADPQRWFFVLCNALERTRRRDISITLQDIMSMNM